MCTLFRWHSKCHKTSIVKQSIDKAPGHRKQRTFICIGSDIQWSAKATKLLLLFVSIYGFTYVALMLSSKIVRPAQNYDTQLKSMPRWFGFFCERSRSQMSMLILYVRPFLRVIWLGLVCVLQRHGLEKRTRWLQILQHIVESTKNGSNGLSKHSVST